MDAVLLKKISVVLIFVTLGFVTVAKAGNTENQEGLSLKNQLIDVRLQLGQQIHTESDIKKKLQSYQNILAVTPDNHETLLKSAYLQFRLGWLYSNDVEKKDHYFKFFDLATRAKLIKPDDYYTRLLMAVAKAKIVGYLPQGDQVRIARELVQEVQLLTDRDNDDPDVIYLLSWLNFKIGQVSSLEKILALVFFGGLPENLSIDKAFVLLKKAIKSRPEYIVYRYDLALYNLKTGNTQRARAQLTEVLSMSPHSTEGEIYRGRAEKKIKKIDLGS